MVERQDEERESMIFATDDLAIFPPINHENIYIDRDQESPLEPSSSLRLSGPSSSSSSLLLLSPSDSDTEFGLVEKSLVEIDIIQCWWHLLLVRLLPKFQRFVTLFSSNCLCSFSTTLRSFYPILGIVMWWLKRKRTRRRLHEGEITTHLRDTIKERDQRIAQLLHQIALMNELLVNKIHSN